MKVRRKLSLIIIGSFLLVSIPTVFGIYVYTKNKTLTQEASVLEQETHAFIALRSADMLNADTNLRSLSDLLESRLAEPSRLDELQEFDSLVENDADGSWRSRRNNFLLGNESGIFIPPDATLDAQQKRLHLRAKRVLDAFSIPAINPPFGNVWLITHEKTEVIFDKRNPDYMWQMAADTDFRKTEWMTLGEPKNNPNRLLKWTRPTFDPVTNAWLVSAVLPFYEGGRWVGNLGQDIYVNQAFPELFTLQHRYSGEQSFLLDQDGEFILAGPWQKNLKTNISQFKVDINAEPALLKLLQTKSTDFAVTSHSYLNFQGSQHLAIKEQLPLLGWTYYKLIPVDSVLATTNRLFYTLLLAILGIAFLLLFTLNQVLNRLFVKRIERLAERSLTRDPKSATTVMDEDEIEQAEKGLDSVIERLNTSEHDMQLIIQNIPTTFAYINADLRYEYVNSRYEKLYGKSATWIAGRKVSELKGEEAQAKIQVYYQRALSGETVTYESKLLSYTGLQITMLMHLIPNLDKTKKVVGIYSIGIDISDLKKSEEIIAASQSLLKSIIDIAPVQIFWKDLESRYLGCNKAFAEDAKLAMPEDVIGMFDQDLLWSEKAEYYQLEDKQVMQTGMPMLNYEHMLVRPTGEVTWAKSSKVPLRNLQGQVIGLLGLDEDITERKQLEEARLQEQKRLQKIASNVPGIVYQMLLSKSGTLSMPFASDAINYIFRLSPDDVKHDASKAFALVHPDDYEDLMMSIEISAKDLTLWREEFRVRYEDGTERWLQGNASPEQQKDGGVLWHGFITDISVQKGIEDQVVQAEYRWRYAIEGIGDGVWDVNVQTDATIYSKRWIEMTGYTEDEIPPTRKAWSSRIHPDDLPHVAADGKAYLDGLTDKYATEYRFLCKDGQYRWMLSRGVIVSRDAKGKPIRVIGTQIDITERKNAQLFMQKAREELEISHHQFKDLYEFAPIGYMTIGAHGLITQLNWRAAALLGLERKSILNQRFTQFVDEVERSRWSRMFTSLKDMEEGEELSFDLKLFLENNLERYVNLNCIRMSDENVESMLRITFEDITRHKQSEAELRVAAIAFESQDGLMITDAQNRILKVNEAFCEITGYTAQDVVGKTPLILSSGVHEQAFFAEMWSSLNQSEQWKGEIWNRRKNGDVYPVNLTITAVKSEIGVLTNYVAAFVDLSKIKEATNEITKLSSYDALTLLPNRRLFLDSVHHAFDVLNETSKEAALIYIDVDNFKVLNDALDYGLGDLLLKEIANRLSSVVKSTDVVARFGGDEFVVLLNGLSTDPKLAKREVEKIALKIQEALSQAYHLNEHDYHMTVSIGVTMVDDDANSPEEVIKESEIAMYQAKEKGRNTLQFFSEQMQSKIAKRVSMERELRKAVAENEFELYYQPQFDREGYVVGVEALIRWFRPEFGLVPPMEFIPIAEESGLIVEIGHWTLNQACKQLKEWQTNAHTRMLTLSINVSAKQFHAPNFFTQVKSTINRYGIDPMLLKLELTESLLLDNMEETIACMQALGDIGVQFSLDDFGTGYSSLQYLKKLPLYQLKIDQSFVRDIVTDRQDRSIVRTIIAMADSLYLNVIAEGVETQEQHALLVEDGCKQFQGYLFARPLAIEALEEFLKNSPVYFRPDLSDTILLDTPSDRLN